MKKLLLLAIVLGTAIVPVYAQQEMTASGKVVSVRLMTRTMTVRDTTANEVIRYNVPRGTAVTMAGQSGRFGYLRSGDTVNISYVNTDDGREAVMIQVPQPNPGMDMRVADGPMSVITGRVENTNSSNRTITVLGDQSGERFTYAVPQDTRITVGGETARLRDLQRGDNVTLRFKEESGERLAARVQVPEPVTTMAQRRAETPPAATTAQAAPRTQLPSTASSLPLYAVFGLLCLVFAGSLTLVRRFRSHSA